MTLKTQSIFLRYGEPDINLNKSGLTINEKMNIMRVYRIDAIGFLAKRNGSYIRWEPYHIKQMGTIPDGNPTI